MMKKLLLLILILSISVISINRYAYSTGNDTAYFYNPENNINNFSTLKTEFDSFLEKYGNYHFQPFNDASNFESLINNKRGGIYLLSNWHLNALKKNKIPLEIVLVATQRNSTTHRKVLSVKNSVTKVEQLLANTVIAGAGSEDYIRSVLIQIIGKDKESLLSSAKILTVPKDIDALMAVNFGMANAAITAENSLKVLAEINPKQFEQLHSLGFSEKSYILVAATLAKTDNSALINVLTKMQESEEGINKLRLLGIDGWKKI